jgi:hypothetical protein
MCGLGNPILYKELRTAFVLGTVKYITVTKSQKCGTLGRLHINQTEAVTNLHFRMFALKTNYFMFGKKIEFCMYKFCHNVNKSHTGEELGPP